MRHRSRAKLWTTVCLSPRPGLIFYRGLFKWKEREHFLCEFFYFQAIYFEFSFCMNHWWFCCRLSVLWCPPCWLARAATRTGLSLLLPPKTQSKIASENQPKRVLLAMIFLCGSEQLPVEEVQPKKAENLKTNMCDKQWMPGSGEGEPMRSQIRQRGGPMTWASV